MQNVCPLNVVLTIFKKKLGFYLLQLFTFSLCIHCKTKTNKKFRVFKKIVDFQSFQKSNFVRQAKYIYIY